MQTSKNYKIGLLALSALAILYYGFWFLKGKNIFSQTNIYYVAYPANKNLLVSAPIKLRGHAIGMITKVEIVPNQNYSTLVTIEIDKKFPLTEHSKVMLNNGSVMNGNILEIELNHGKPLKKGTIIKGEVHPTFSEIDIQAVTSQISTITSSLIKTTQSVNAILNNLEQTSATFSQAIDTLQQNVQTVSTHIMAISKPLADPKKGIPPIVHATHKILAKVNALPLDELSCSMRKILDNTEAVAQGLSGKQGTLGMLIYDPELYNQLNQTSKNLNNLLQSIQRQPQRYVHFSLFGAKSIPIKRRLSK